MDVINPATGEVIEKFVTDTPQTIEEKYQQARAAQPEWGALMVSERVEYIAKFRELMKRDLDTLALDLTKETGKPLQQSKNEVLGGINKLKFFLEKSEEYLSAEKVNEDGNTEEFLAYDPLGVIANISAWNYPYLVGINIFVPALICGNAVMYKPSEFSMLTGRHITRLLHEAGIPEDIFVPVYGDGSVGALLTALPLDGYFFTGSYPTGKKIAEAVAGKLVPVGLELGGKDPLYVTEDISDIEAVADAVAEGVLYNNGQSCCSVERVYVHDDIFDEFITQLKKKMSAWKVGNPMDESTMCGAITRRSHLDFMKAQIEDAKAKGAKVLLGGKIIEGKGNFFEPTLLINVDHEMDVMIEETFGPVIGVMRVESDEEAIELMNDTDFGLTSSVYCADEERGEEILSQIHSGTGYLNCCDRVSGYLPWSGRGRSGLGSTLSKHGLYAFCNPKGLHIRL
ncbi:MAG: aldehyde dehydrogenase family protein [Deltaproteobacteria bacterium]|nr:MAG: aldehyde dehydrogenase family protein [Deltaproteobacteria bacterium]